MILVIISREKWEEGEQAAFKLKRRCGGDGESRLVELYSTIVIDVFFHKIASKCSVTNSFIPKRRNTINQNYTDLDKDINTESSVGYSRYKKRGLGG